MSTTTSSGFNGSPGCLMLFALPFAAVGVGMALWLGHGLVDFVRMQRWAEVPATITRADLKVSHGSKSTTYEATAEYTYRYQGHAYRGQRVGIGSGSDNVGSYQQNLHHELSSHVASHKPFRCYVNPARPSEAILYRQLRWEMATFQTVFVLAFGGAGFSLLIAGARAVRQARRKAALASAHPDEPWLWRDEWAEGNLRSSAENALVVALVVATAWNAVVAPLWFLVLPEVLKGNRVALVGLILPAIGVGLLGWAVVAVLRWHKFHESLLQLAAVPGVIGGRLAGVIHTSAKIQPEDGFHLSLKCIHRMTTGSGKNRSTSDRVIWEDEQIVAHELLQADPTRSAIPLLFQIPYDCQATSDEDSDNQILWRLEAKAKVPGIAYHARFEVPVFKTDKSDPHFTPDPTALAAYVAPANPERDLKEAGVIVSDSPTGEGRRFSFPLGRNMSVMVFSAVFALVFTAATVFLTFNAPFFFPIVFGLLALGTLLVAQDVWLYCSVIDVSRRGLSVTGGPLGLGRTRWVDAANVSRIEAVSHMSAGQTTYYDVLVVCGDGKRVTLGKRLAGQHRAAAVVAQIQQALGKA